MEKCPKCNSEKIRSVIPRRARRHALSLNSTWGICNDCKYHWPSANPSEGYFVKPIKNPELANGGFLAVFGVIFLLVGVFAVTSTSMILRWILVSLGGLLLGYGAFLVVHWLLRTRRGSR